MRRYEHGGNTYALPSGCIDFSANLNPLGMPASARRALLDGVDLFERYPDPNCTELTQALATMEQVPKAWVLPCAGATDAFTRLCSALRPRRGLVCAPCYSGYEQALDQAGAEIARHTLRQDEGFAVTQAFATCVADDIDIAFVANPNNPTGLCVDRAVLVGCLERAQATGTTVVVDECFVDLTCASGSNDLLACYDNLVLVKALTKTFALAGLRVGYALCANGSLMDRMREAGQPWAVSVPAQLAGVACANEPAHVAAARALVAHERGWLQGTLEELGLTVVPGQANYLLFHGPADLDAALLEHGILVRPCDNYAGLDGRWYRIAVRTHELNERLVAALQSCV